MLLAQTSRAAAWRTAQRGQVMSNLTREQIRAANDRPSEEVPVPEWARSGTVTLQVMSGTNRDRLEAEMAGLRGSASQIDPEKLIGFKARLVILCAINGDGEPLFRKDDASWLNDEKSGNVLNRLADVALRINGLTERSLEDMAGNLPTPSVSSGFDLPDTSEA